MHSARIAEHLPQCRTGFAMSLFIKDGKIKSTVLLNGFMFSMAFTAVYILAFIAAAAALEKIIPEATPNLLLVWLPPVLISLIASVICALPLFFISHHENVIAAFIFIAVYAVFIIAALLLKYDSESRLLLIQPLIFYFALPAVFGNLVCHTVIRLKDSEK
ncbi:hypothetical protein AGMMS50293_10070 [Spirochaetia bacterium]|nr:hypothetical protein AGMMS50293_10070 [Spirochaetia bacterium]